MPHSDRQERKTTRTRTVKGGLLVRVFSGLEHFFQIVSQSDAFGKVYKKIKADYLLKQKATEDIEFFRVSFRKMNRTTRALDN